MESVNQKYTGNANYQTENKKWLALRDIAEYLVEAEQHHQREGKILFPELEKRGIFGPPQVMRQEHDDLRGYKHELERLSQKIARLDFINFKKKLKAVARFLIFNLRDHIFKEDNIFYIQPP